MPPQHSLLTPEFEKYARLLNDLSIDGTAVPFYELMSGALMWPDEKAKMPVAELGWFRAALNFRSSLILQGPRTEFEPVWNALKQAAPNWPGFRPERCTPSPELVEILTKQKRKSARYLDRQGRAESGKWKPLSGKAGSAPQNG
jgi:hypothetical protein